MKLEITRDSGRKRGRGEKARCNGRKMDGGPVVVGNTLLSIHPFFRLFGGRGSLCSLSTSNFHDVTQTMRFLGKRLMNEYADIYAFRWGQNSTLRKLKKLKISNNVAF